MARFTAPADAPAPMLSTGAARIVDGVLEIHRPTADDVAQLRAQGFALIATGVYFALPAPDHPDDPLPEPAA